MVPINDEAIDRTGMLAAFLATTSAYALPERCLELARRYTLDTLGVAVFGADKPWSRSAAEYVHHAQSHDGGTATVIGHAWLADPAGVAFANGVASHAFELDDVHDEAILHPGAVVVPAALAIAEHTGASGLDFLAAVVCGYEAMARVGLAVDPAAHMLHGFHPTASCGPFGAAAAAARLLGLNSGGMVSALGLAASFAGGIMEFSRSGGMVKRVHAGHAAENGVKAAALAARGLEGPRRGLDGTFGFCRAFSPSPALSKLNDQLGERFMIDEITIKPYACCSDIHPIIDALLAIRRRHRLDPTRIASIRIKAPRKVIEQNTIDGTSSIMAAQYSAQYTAALTLLRDIEDPGIYSSESLADETLAKLQEKVTVVHEPRFDERYAWMISGGVEVHMDDGAVVSETIHGARGSIHRPLSDTEVAAKFRKLTAERLGQTGSSNLVRAIAALADAPNLNTVVQHLRTAFVDGLKNS
jgi:2-methylcitrate dehydratase PrpD